MKIAYFLTHPIQYQSPLIRALVAGGIDLHVFYASDNTSRAYFDPGYGRQVAWDVPLLDGYRHTVLNKQAPKLSRPLLINHYREQVGRELEPGGFSAAWIHGWHHPFAVGAWQSAKKHGLPIMLRGDTFLGSINAGPIKRLLHRLYYSHRFREIDLFLAIGTLNRELYLTYGAKSERVIVMPHAVDNAFFQSKAAEAHPNREALRASLGIAPGRPIVLFCGRYSEQKDPATLIKAVGALGAELNPKPVALLVGDGPIRPELEALASEVARGSVVFAGFRNQTELPALYDLCDVFVLPSRFEPWGLVVNEVMNAAKPVIVSDLVGAAPDLVKPGRNGDVFKTSDVRDLATKLRHWISSPAVAERGGRESLDIINHWSLEDDVVIFRQALERLKPSAAFARSGAFV